MGVEGAFSRDNRGDIREQFMGTTSHEHYFQTWTMSSQTTTKGLALNIIKTYDV